jgi:hypothetical protein
LARFFRGTIPLQTTVGAVLLVSLVVRAWAAAPALPTLSLTPRAGLAPLRVRVTGRLRAPAPGDQIVRLELRVGDQDGPVVAATERDTPEDGGPLSVALETTLDAGPHVASVCVVGRATRCVWGRVVVSGGR